MHRSINELFVDKKHFVKHGLADSGFGKGDCFSEPDGFLSFTDCIL